MRDEIVEQIGVVVDKRLETSVTYKLLFVELKLFQAPQNYREERKTVVRFQMTLYELTLLKRLLLERSIDSPTYIPRPSMTDSNGQNSDLPPLTQPVLHRLIQKVDKALEDLPSASNSNGAISSSKIL